MPLVVKFGEISERFQIICARLLPKPPQPLPHPSLLHLQPLLLILRCSLNLSRKQSKGNKLLQKQHKWMSNASNL
ncbi:hypothetical protein Pyn_27690 [Prunus yedoensis var. nudiflora]|uniref:Uncharacterized protein n=1 Tax=Prunus yedoensis var. nudiflora TaxID=2094558 RepID=A0A314UAE9_PRUYE|nr:hypothetical protein Pyn_27690 [Prunus yedoensis var. nudiflora]